MTNTNICSFCRVNQGSPGTKHVPTRDPVFGFREAAALALWLDGLSSDYGGFEPRISRCETYLNVGSTVVYANDQTSNI